MLIRVRRFCPIRRVAWCLAVAASLSVWAQDEPPPDDPPPPPDPTYLDANDTDKRGPDAKDADGNDLIWIDNLYGNNSGGYVYGGVVTLDSAPTPSAVPNGNTLPTTLGGDSPQSHTNSDPVMGSGEFVLTQTDLDFPGFGVSFTFTRTYRSRVSYSGSMGFGWSHNFQRRIVSTTANGAEDCAGYVYYISGSMERIRFSVAETSIDSNHVVYTAGPDTPLRLDRFRDHADQWELRDGSPEISYFDGDTGALDRVADVAGNALTVHWNHAIKNGEQGVVSSVQDTTGRVFYFHYDTLHPTDNQDIAILRCISLSSYASDCDDGAQKALLYFDVSDDSKTYQPFDLLGVRSANGTGPSYTYYRSSEATTYAADADLPNLCHNYCDVKGNDATSCHNYDFCDTEIDALTAKACDMASSNTLPIVCAGQLDPEACTLNSDVHYATAADNSDGYKDAPFFNLAPFYYTENSSGGLVTSETWHLDDGRYDPGFGFCLASCLDEVPGSSCYSDVFPYCRGLEPYRDVQGASEELGWERNIYRQACGCMYGQNVTYCHFHPTAPGCDALTKRATGIPYQDGRPDHKVLGGFGLPGNFFKAYAQACTPITNARIHAQNPNCPSTCYQGCITQMGGHDPGGTRRYAFGRVEDLNHNLLEVYDGDGRLVLRNTYGADPFQQSFDRVSSHQLTDSQPDNVLTFDYHDLQLEQAKLNGNLPLLLSTLPNTPTAANGLASRTFDASGMNPAAQYNLTLDPIHVESLNQFRSTEVCPEICSSILTTVATERANNLIPIAALSAAERALLSQSGLTLRRLSDGTLSVDPPTSPGHIPKVFDLETHKGRVTLTQSREAAVYKLSGQREAIDTLFGRDGEFSLRESIEGSRRRSVSGAGTKPGESAFARAEREAALVKGPPEPAIIRYLHEAAVAQTLTQSRERLGTSTHGSVLFVTSPPRPGSSDNAAFIAAVRSGGYLFGSPPLTFVRGPDNTARLGRLPSTGDQVARIDVEGVSVTLYATDRADIFKADERAASLFDEAGLARIAIMPGGTIVGEPAAKLRAKASEYLKHPPYARADTVSEASAQSCPGWSIYPAKTGSSISEVQNPRYAVVAHDVRGVIETRYYDESWRLLREVNDNTKEVTDYNYMNGTVHGTRYPAGDRLCRNADRFGRDLETQRIPAPNFPGETAPQVTQYAYSAGGHLAKIVRDPGTPYVSSIRFDRDATDRPHLIESTIDAKHTKRVALGYASATKSDGPDSYPMSITEMDGFQIGLNKYDPRGGGPADTTIGLGSADPSLVIASYDPFGRLQVLRRAKHSGSETHFKYDLGGRMTTSGHADITAPGTWVDTTITYNGSDQPVLESSDHLNRCSDFDALNHLHWINELPKDGVTESRAACFRTGIDGKVDYVVTPIGSVQIYHYDANGRLAKQEEGYPTNIAAWTNACLNNLPPPSEPRHIKDCGLARKGAGCRNQRSEVTATAVGLSKSRSAAAYVTVAPPVSSPDKPLIRLLPASAETKLKAVRSAAQGRVVAAGARPLSQFNVCNATVPTWPGTKPANDTGIETTATYVFGPGGFSRAISDGQGIGLKFRTDGFGRVIAASDGMKGQLWRGYDSRNRLTWQATLNPTSQPYARPQTLSATLPLQSMQEYSYDDLDRLVSVETWNFADGKQIDPAKLKIVTTYVYDDTADRVSVTVDGIPAGQRDTDGLGRNTVLTLPDGKKVTFEYSDDAVSDSVSVRYLANGQVLERKTQYDNHGQLLRILDHRGNEIEGHSYDRWDRPTSVTQAQSSLMGFSYDAYNRIVTWTKGSNPAPDHTIQFTWDRSNRQTSTITTNVTLGPNVSTNIFDGLNRIIESDDPEGRQRKLSYYTGTYRVRRVDQAGSTSIVYTYDSAGRPRELSGLPGASSGLDSAAFKRRYTFNAFGLLASAQVLSGANLPAQLTTTFDYDSRGNEIGESTGGFLPLDIHHTYDSFGALLDTSLTAHTGTEQATIHRARDRLGRLNAVNLNSTTIVALSYQGLGEPTQLDFGAKTADGYPVVVTQNFDQRGRALGADVRAGSAIIASINERLGSDNIPRLRDVRLGTSQKRTDLFEVDDSGQLLAEGLGASLPNNFNNSVELTNADVDSSIATSSLWNRYLPDGLGNWSSTQDQTGTVLNSMDGLSGYKSFGNHLAAYDSNRDLTALDTNVYRFDALGELISSKSNSHKMAFLYDALGRRVGQTDTSSGHSTYTLWSGYAPLAIGNTRSNPSHYTVRIPGDRLNDHLALAGNLGTDKPVYLHQAPNQSIFAVSDDSGLIEGFDYSAFGNTMLLPSTGASDVTASRSADLTFGAPFLYQGQSYAASLQQYYMRAREYKPSFGRFLSPDPIGMAGGYNLYAFANSAPLAYTDSLGLDPTHVAETHAPFQPTSATGSVNHCCTPGPSNVVSVSKLSGLENSIVSSGVLTEPRLSGQGRLDLFNFVQSGQTLAPGLETVILTFRRANLPLGGFIDTALGKRHVSVMTDMGETGQGKIGGGVPGQGAEGFAYTLYTQMLDHTGQSQLPGTINVPVTVNRDAFVREVSIGEAKGIWVPLINDCNCVMRDAVEKAGGDWDAAYNSYLLQNQAYQDYTHTQYEALKAAPPRYRH